MSDNTAEFERLAQLRQQWKQWAKNVLEPMPDELRDLTCGAKTRAGTPCKRRDLYKSGRCRLHGGLSTGPKPKTP